MCVDMACDDVLQKKMSKPVIQVFGGRCGIRPEASAAQYEQQLAVVGADQDRLRRLYENAPLGYQWLEA